MPPDRGQVWTGNSPLSTPSPHPPVFPTSLASFGLSTTPTSSSPIQSASGSSSTSRHFRSNSNVSDLPSPGSIDVAAASALAREGYPLLLRRAAAGASASTMRLRRGSMLGNELRPGEPSRRQDRENWGGGDRSQGTGRRRDLDRRESSPSPVLRRSPPNGSTSVVPARRRSRSPSTEQFVLDGDEVMEVDSRKREYKERQTPHTPPRSEPLELPTIGGAVPSHPTMGSSPGAGTPMRGPGSFRRGVSRRGPLALRDKSVLRVAATLQDESAPGDSEVASEAKLQRRLGDLSFPSSPFSATQNGRHRVPIFGTYRPAGTNTAPWAREDDDVEGSVVKDRTGSVSEDGYPSSSEDSPPTHPSTDIPDIDEVEMLDGNVDALGTSTPNNSAPNVRMSAIWTGIRDGKRRASPGADRGFRSRTPGVSITSSANVSPIALTGVSGAYQTSANDADSSMDSIGLPSAAAAALSHARQTTPAAISPVLWATRGTSSTSSNVSKRKHADERFEPYASSVHKRRAVSPMTLLTLSHSHSAHAHAHLVARGTPSPIGASAPTTVSMLSSALRSPSLLASQHHSAGSTNGVPNLPTPTPLSMPSPTLSHYSSLSTTPVGAPVGPAQHYFASVHQGGHGHHPRSSSGSIVLGSTPWPINVASSRTRDSPNTRPSTPTGVGAPMPLSLSAAGGPGPSPSLLATSAGSGPGYGSGALGLSLSGNAKAGPLARRRRAQTPAGASGPVGQASQKEVDVNGRSSVGWAAAGDSDSEDGEEMDEGVRMLGLE